jgi:pyridinium-3,5-biscarboxylic acid mononucleotide sulfurtransferase
MADKLSNLKNTLKGYQKLAIAFSGGLDSTFLAAAAAETLCRKNVLLLMAQGPIIPENQIRDAEKTTANLGLQIIKADTDVMSIGEFTCNSTMRCYYCKKHLFAQIQQQALEMGFEHVACGTNTDDYSDYRPGNKAVEELGVLCPLADAGMSKDDIRNYARRMKLPQADMPTTTCLATRLPYDTEITPEILKQIEKSEQVLYELGFTGFRVRFCGDTARIELPQSQMSRILEKDTRDRICSGLRKTGLNYITLDLDGYQSGSMNRGISK